MALGSGSDSLEELKSFKAASLSHFVAVDILKMGNLKYGHLSTHLIRCYPRRSLFIVNKARANDSASQPAPA